MRGVHALIICLLAGLALSGCMHSTGPVATAPPQSDLDAMAYGQPYRSDPAAAVPSRSAVADSGGAISALRSSFAASPRATYAPAPAVYAAPMPVVFDHFGGARASLGTSQPGFDTMVDLVHSGKAYVKISGAYRSSDKAPDYPDVASLAKTLIAANAERIVWGSDWPHPAGGALPGHTASDIAPLSQIDDGLLLNQLAVWAPDAAVRKKILVDNPSRLYGF